MIPASWDMPVLAIRGCVSVLCMSITDNQRLTKRFGRGDATVAQLLTW